MKGSISLNTHTSLFFIVYYVSVLYCLLFIIYFLDEFYKILLYVTLFFSGYSPRRSQENFVDVPQPHEERLDIQHTCIRKQ